MIKVYLAGAASFFSSYFTKHYRNNFHLSGSYRYTKPNNHVKLFKQIDTHNLNEIKKHLEKERPDILINTIALTSIEECEINQNQAYQSNVVIPEILAGICNELDIKFIQISTDMLWDGSKLYYQESDEPNPLNFYGKTKKKSEKKVMHNNSDALVIRTNFFGRSYAKNNSFSDFIINNLNRNQEINLFEDVFYTPIHISYLSNIMMSLAYSSENGIFNVSSSERLSKYEFGLKIADIYNLNNRLINACSISSRTDLVIRPNEMSISNEKLTSKMEINIPCIQDQLKESIND